MNQQDCSIPMWAFALPTDIIGTVYDARYRPCIFVINRNGFGFRIFFFNLACIENCTGIGRSGRELQSWIFSFAKFGWDLLVKSWSQQERAKLNIQSLATCNLIVQATLFLRYRVIWALMFELIYKTAFTLTKHLPINVSIVNRPCLPIVTSTWSDVILYRSKLLV